MKTSKIIFISLLSLIALTILAATVSIRITGIKRTKDNYRLKTFSTPLSAFSVICLKNCNNITLIKSDSSYDENILPVKNNNFHLDVSVKEDSTAPFISYIIKEDTLLITDFKNPASSSIYVKVYVGNGLKTIQMEKSDIRIYVYKMGIFSMTLDNSKVYFSSAIVNNSFINKVNITGKNHSIITANSVVVDSFQLALQNSGATLSVSAKIVSGTLSDSSKLITIQPREISLKRDATSSINFLGR
jgi:hypothetical protein